MKCGVDCGDVNVGGAESSNEVVKIRLAAEIARAVKVRGLTQTAAARLMGMSQSKVSLVMHSDVKQFSVNRLMACLNGLGYDVEIQVRPAARSRGNLVMATA